MKNLNSILGRTTTLLALGAMLSLPASSRATTVSLNVNSSLSSLTLSGTAFLLPGQEQPGRTGSLVDSWGGTITGDLTAGVWNFIGGGSSITAVVNPITPPPFSTAPWPISSGLIENYGVYEFTSFHPVYGAPVTINGAYRGLVLDLTAGTAQDGSPTALTLTFTGGSLDWGATVTGFGTSGGNSGMATVTGGNTDPGNVSWDGTTLILPVTFHTIGSNRTEDWTGTLVATIPEPTTVALALVGVGLLAATSRARARRS